MKKHGQGSVGHQCYRCQACCRSFQLEYEYRACQQGMKTPIIKPAMNNAGIRDTARALHISINAVVLTLKKLSPKNATSLPLDNLQIQLICEVDEKHITGKLYTQRIERENLNLRNRLKRLNRKTLGYSKSAGMYDKIIGTFIEREYYAL